MKRVLVILVLCSSFCYAQSKNADLIISGDSQFQKNNYREAITYYKNASDLSSLDNITFNAYVPLLWRLGYTYMLGGNYYDGALTFITVNKIIETRSYSGKLGSAEDIRRVFAKYEYKPYFGNTHEKVFSLLCAGICLFKLGNYQDALVELKKAALLSEEYPAVHYLMGLCYEEVGDRDNAIAAYRKTLEYQKDFKPAERRLESLKNKREKVGRLVLLFFPFITGEVKVGENNSEPIYLLEDFATSEKIMREVMKAGAALGKWAGHELLTLGLPTGLFLVLMSSGASAGVTVLVPLGTYVVLSMMLGESDIIFALGASDEEKKKKAEERKLIDQLYKWYDFPRAIGVAEVEAESGFYDVSVSNKTSLIQTWHYIPLKKGKNMLLVIDSDYAFNSQKTEITHGNSITGHIKGTLPFIMGGSDISTPNKEFVDTLHREGVALSLSWQELYSIYKKAGILTDLDKPYTNNLDEYGPHVILGGKSMVTPTPGTANYENIIMKKEK